MMRKSLALADHFALPDGLVDAVDRGQPLETDGNPARLQRHAPRVGRMCGIGRSRALHRTDLPRPSSRAVFFADGAKRYWLAPQAV